MTIRTRFAPSPTGNVHIGNIRAAIYNWLFSRHEGGEFLLQIGANYHHGIRAAHEQAIRQAVVQQFA